MQWRHPVVGLEGRWRIDGRRVREQQAHHGQVPVLTCPVQRSVTERKNGIDKSDQKKMLIHVYGKLYYAVAFFTEFEFKHLLQVQRVCISKT
jgi:hypothetical protein